MAEVEINASTLTVNVIGWDRVWALKSRLDIPLEHVRGARIDPDARMSWKRLKVVGTRVPGVIAAGRFYEHGDLVFWDVRDPSKAITIDLIDERYKRLVIQVEDPDTTVACIQNALRAG